MNSTQSKLTLRFNSEIIEKAKEIAGKRGTSVSKMVEEYFELLSASELPVSELPDVLGERTRFLRGILTDDKSND